MTNTFLELGRLRALLEHLDAAEARVSREDTTACEPVEAWVQDARRAIYDRLSGAERACLPPKPVRGPEWVFEH